MTSNIVADADASTIKHLRDLLQEAEAENARLKEVIAKHERERAEVGAAFRKVMSWVETPAPAPEKPAAMSNASRPL